MNKKHRIQKTLALLIGLLLVANVALAADGNANLFTDERSTEYIQSAAAVKDSLYFLGNEGFYRWSREMTEPLKVSEDVKSWGMPPEGTDESDPIASFDGSIQTLVGSSAGLFGINTNKGLWCSIEEKGGKWLTTPLKTLNWEGMLIDEEEWTHPRYIEQAIMQEDILALLLQGDSSGFGHKNDLICFDIEKGTQNKIEVENIQEIADYKEGKILALQFDGNLFGENIKEMANVITIDLKTGNAAPFMQLPYAKMAGLAYDQKEDCIYISGDGSIFSGKFGEELVALNYIPVYEGSNAGQAAVLDGGLYGIRLYNKTYVRSLDSSLKPNRVLTIEGASEWEDGVKAFERVQPGIPVKFVGTTWRTENLLQKMLAGDTVADIYALSIPGDALDTLKNKGYLIDLSTSKILIEKVEGMYPQIKDTIMQDGQLIAFPSSLRVPAKWCADSVFEEMGLEKPKTWADLLAIYRDWGDYLADDYPEYTLLDSQYHEEGEASIQIFYEMMSAYAEDRLLRGAPLRFDTPVFKNLLALFEAYRPSIDLIKPTENTGYYIHSEEPKNLFYSYEEITPTEYQTYVKGSRLILAFEEGEPGILSSYFNVYIINPSSKNQDLAMLFLETFAQNMPQYIKVALSPDENEPLVSPHAAQNIEDLEERLKEQEKSLETAQEADALMIKEEIKWTKEYIEETKNSNWYWDLSPEKIELFRSFDGQWGIIANHPLMQTSNEDNNMGKTYKEYLDGAISKEELVRRLDQKVQMVEMEAE